MIKTTSRHCFKSSKRAFSLMEIMVASAIFTVVLAGMVAGSMQFARYFHQIRKVISARGDLSRFSNSLNSFGSRSLSVFFQDNNGTLNYLAQSSVRSNSNLDILYFEKEDGNEARLIYNSTDHRLEWYRLSGTTDPAIMLENVYRLDWDGVNEGERPVIRFPHDQEFLYNDHGNGTDPKFFIIEFRHKINTGTKKGTMPYNIPFRMMVPVNTNS